MGYVSIIFSQRINLSEATEHGNKRKAKHLSIYLGKTRFYTLQACSGHKEF